MTGIQKRLRLIKFRKGVMAGKTQTKAAIDAGCPPASAHNNGSKMMKDPEVINGLEAAFRRIEADEQYLATKIKDGVDKLRPGAAQLAYLDVIKDGLGYNSKKQVESEGNTFNILSIIQQHGLVGKNGQTIEAKGLVEP